MSLVQMNFEALRAALKPCACAELCQQKSYNTKTSLGKTQKARGLGALLDWLDVWTWLSSSAIKLVPFVVYRGMGAREAINGIMSFPKVSGRLFVRPCPMVPRHGFVESRTLELGQITTELVDQQDLSIYPTRTVRDQHKIKELLDQVLEEAQAADPAAELLIAPFIEATHNIVVANGTLTIGPEHDGATAGRDCLVISCPQVNFPPSMLNAALVCVSPFIEAVAGKANGGSIVYVTQLRDGPKVPSQCERDYVPKETTVRLVLTPTSDLLAWERLVKKHEGEEGVVANIPMGSLSSHAAIHCVLNKMSVVCSRRVQVGDRLVCIAAEHDGGKLDLKAFVGGIKLGFTADSVSSVGCAMDSFAQLTSISLFALHAFSNLHLDRQVDAAVLGFGAATAARLGFIAALGELRHVSRLRSASSPSGVCVKSVELLSAKAAREEIFQRAFSLSPTVLASKFEGLFPRFALWGWKGSYGGIKWLSCSVKAAELWNVLADFLIWPDESKLKPTVAALNALVNACHNGAQMLTKFLNSTMFALAEDSPSALAVLASPTLYQTFMKKLPSAEGKLKVPKVCIDSDMAELCDAFEAGKLVSLDQFTFTELVGSLENVVHPVAPTFSFTGLLGGVYAATQCGKAVVLALGGMWCECTGFKERCLKESVTDSKVIHMILESERTTAKKEAPTKKLHPAYARVLCS